jgi:uncharacterized membrane-anchored protein YitT (DUF2179 family)
MKKFITISFIVIVLLSNSVLASDLRTVKVHVQDGFNGQNVSILANEIRLWHSKNAVSDFSLGFVDSFKFYINNGKKLKIQVIIDNKEYVKEINIRNDIFIGVTKNVENDIVITVTKKPFIYD